MFNCTRTGMVNSGGDFNSSYLGVVSFLCNPCDMESMEPRALRLLKDFLATMLSFHYSTLSFTREESDFYGVIDNDDSLPM